ncbi:MAG: hypothetical protein RIS94_490 [Pseudomonadota bacterium]|jgi:hypothetical protein
MLSRLSTRAAGRLWAALLVLTIAFHAGTPVSAALDLRSGSAFSADTMEVAVAPARRDATQRVALVPVPLPERPHAVPLFRTGAAQPDHRWPDATGPPASAPLLARKAAPRAPPAA